MLQSQVFPQLFIIVSEPTPFRNHSRFVPNLVGRAWSHVHASGALFLSARTAEDAEGGRGMPKATLRSELRKRRSRLPVSQGLSEEHTPAADRSA